MSQRMRQYLPLLKRITRMSDKVRRRYLKNCDKAIMDCFSECAVNILKGHVPLSNRQFTRLKRTYLVEKEAQHRAKGRFHTGPVVASNRHARECPVESHDRQRLMEHARRLYLVDDFDRVYR